MHPPPCQRPSTADLCSMPSPSLPCLVTAHCSGRSITTAGDLIANLFRCVGSPIATPPTKPRSGPEPLNRARFRFSHEVPLSDLPVASNNVHHATFVTQPNPRSSKLDCFVQLLVVERVNHSCQHSPSLSNVALHSRPARSEGKCTTQMSTWRETMVNNSVRSGKHR